ncbi:hypothetical protein [Natronoglycomyces albus]|uniref:Uncharacterized protein n=1 Tax=Natronoglycomyces albus TaxID=2811108 RepID=A0A895XSR6_9ACTN|nr:hypothetical protein [Natronoglycomyces albus]QSB04678.1 hypothetical protein JQS30_12985 [Natronoglycomyces albus]
MPYEEAEVFEMDVDGDGKPDTVGVMKNAEGHTEYHIDTTGDGKANMKAVDFDNDGAIDKVSIDTTGDQNFDTVVEDTTGDGVLDSKKSVEG